MTIALEGRPDAFGFKSGWYEAPDGRDVRVKGLPPQHEWFGDTFMEGYAPHESMWLIYANGKEVAHVEEREQLTDLNLSEVGTTRCSDD